RIDIHVEVPPVRYADLAASTAAEDSMTIRARVNTARMQQRARFAGTAIPHNAAMGVREIRQYCTLDSASKRLLGEAMRHCGLSGGLVLMTVFVRWRGPSRLWLGERTLAPSTSPKRFSTARSTVGKRFVLSPLVGGGQAYMPMA